MVDRNTLLRELSRKLDAAERAASALRDFDARRGDPRTEVSWVIGWLTNAYHLIIRQID